MYFAENDPAIYKFDGENWPKRRQGYWFPYWFKFIAWFITLGTIIVCIVFLVLYGLTFGLLKCHLWITTIFLSLFIGVMIIQPARVLLVSFIFVGLMKSPPALSFKRIPVKYLQNPYSEKAAFIAYRRRLDNTPYYVPVPQYKLEGRAENIKYHLEQRKLFVDVVIFIVFVIVLSYIIVIHKSGADYYSTEVVKHLTIYGTYTNTIPFTEVISYRQFVEYLNETLFPALYGNGTRPLAGGIALTLRSLKPPRKARKDEKESKKGTADKKPQRKMGVAPVWDEESLLDVRERFVRAENESQKKVSNIFERSWTLDPSTKLIGKPRMRQLRVKNNTCSGIEKIKPRENLCFAEFSLANEERGNFYLWWQTYTDEILTPQEQKPWLYQSAWKTGAIYLIAKHSSYPGDGYVLELAKNLDDSRVILDFMDAFQWIDARTRVVIIEFTLYSVNVNLFNVVFLIAEKSATGYFITSHQIITAKFMFLASELEIISVSMMIAFVSLLLLFTYREAIRIGRTSLKSYLTEGNPTLDILIIILGTISVSFIFLRSLYVTSLLRTLDESQNYEYVSFAYAAVWDIISTYVNALLIGLAALKLFHLLRFRVVFLQLQQTLRGCRHYFLGIGVQLVIILIAFSLFFYLVLVPFDYDFSSFTQTVSSLIGRAFCLDDTYDNSVFSNTPWFVAPLFYAAFILIMAVLVWSFFISVICYHLRRVKKTHIHDKYNALAYLKHILTANERTDIMRLKGGGLGFEDEPTSILLRLRGGGAACAKCCLGNEEKYQLPPKYAVNNLVIKRRKPIFTSPKLYDFHESIQLNDRYRLEAMKRITKARLEKDILLKITDREAAMKAFVLHKLNPQKQKLPEMFYRVSQGNEKGLVSTGTMLNMKQMVDMYGRMRICEKYENSGLQLIILPEDIVICSDVIEEFNKKISELLGVTNRMYKEERKRKMREMQKSMVLETNFGENQGQPDGKALDEEKSAATKEKELTEGTADKAVSTEDEEKPRKSSSSRSKKVKIAKDRGKEHTRRESRRKTEKVMHDRGRGATKGTEDKAVSTEDEEKSKKRSSGRRKKVKIAEDR